MKYRFLALIGLLALSAGAVMQAQDYDDIYYDASKSASATKAEKQSKTVSTFGEVPEKYKAVAQNNYRVERDEDEYNRRGNYEPNYQLNYEVDINGDTIYFDGDTIYDDEAFANTRRIERFYNPDIVILSDDDDLVELYYDESPTVNLVIGTDLGLAASYGWTSSYYPWYTGWYPYHSYYYSWYDPWSPYWYHPWYRPWYSDYMWGWSYMGYRPWWYGSPWSWNYAYGHYSPHTYHWTGYNPGIGNGTQRHFGTHDRGSNGRIGLASNRNPRGRDSRVGTAGGGRGISSPTGTGRAGTSSVRGGMATSRSGNMGSSRVGSATTRPGTTTTRVSGATTRPSGGSRPSSSVGSSRPSSSSSMGSRPSGGSSMGSGSRPSGGSSMGSGGGSSRGSSGGSSGGGGGTGRRH